MQQSVYNIYTTFNNVNIVSQFISILTSINKNNTNTLLPIEYDMDIDDNESICSEISLLDSEYSDSDSYSVSSDDNDFDLHI